MHIELTETEVLRDEDQARRVLSGLRDSGVKIWLDDFGTDSQGSAIYAAFRWTE